MFFGWYVVAGTFVAQLFVVGFFTYAVSLLVSPVRQEFGVNLEEVMYSLTAGTFLGMVFMPMAGAMIDRFPVRWIMTGGALLFAAGLWALSKSTSITQYIVLFGLTMSAANCFVGSTACSATVSRWFTTSRGRALGISAIGTSVGGIAIPALVTWWLSRYDWRTTLENLALCVALVVLPVVILTIRGKPSDVGMLPEGGVTADPAATPAPELTLKDVARHPAYWYIGLTLGLLFSVYTSILANITPYATGAGATAAQASSLIMVVAISGLIGKLAFGFAADKLDLKIGLWIALGLVCASFLILATEPAYPLMILSTVLMGLAAGGMLPVWGAMMARAFGLASFGRAMGLMGPLITILVMPGFTVTGMLYDATGSYQLCLVIFAAVTVLAAALLVPLRLAPAD